MQFQNVQPINLQAVVEESKQSNANNSGASRPDQSSNGAIKPLGLD